MAALIYVIIKTRKLIATINLVGFKHYISTNYLEVNTAFSKENTAFSKENVDSLRINEINHKLWIIVEKSGKIRSCHCTCMAGMGQFCSHVAAAMYRIEAAVRNGLTNLSSTSTASQWLRNHKDVQPMKVKDMKFGLEDFCQQGKKKRPFVSIANKKYNLLREQGDTKARHFGASFCQQ